MYISFSRHVVEVSELHGGELLNHSSRSMEFSIIHKKYHHQRYIGHNRADIPVKFLSLGTSTNNAGPVYK